MTMSIKKNKPNSKSGYKQGYYQPKNINKYNGEFPIIYRSSWERKFCHWCDYNEYVISWMSEPFYVNYFNILDKKFHKYYPDFYFRIKRYSDKDSDEYTIENYVVEIKPKSQLKKPKEPKRKSVKSLRNYKHAYETYIRNLCKTESLKKLSKDRNFKLMLLTEDSNIF